MWPRSPISATAELLSKLYNSDDDDGVTGKFYDRILSDKALSNQGSLVSVCDVLDAVRKQKLRKAVSCDGIAMEAIMYGGLRLTVHVSCLMCLSNLVTYRIFYAFCNDASCEM